jgi:hypothetical protein
MLFDCWWYLILGGLHSVTALVWGSRSFDLELVVHTRGYYLDRQCTESMCRGIIFNLLLEEAGLTPGSALVFLLRAGPRLCRRAFPS